MTKPQIILIGAGGHAVSCIDVIEQVSEFSIFGLVGKSSELNKKLLGYEVIATDEDYSRLINQCPLALITVGQIKSPEIRIALYEKTKQHGFELPTIISPSAYVSPHASIGSGTIIMPGAVINAGVRIGRNCIINSNALIEHNSEVHDHCHISTGVILNGEVNIDVGTFIGSGSIVKQGIVIGKNCLVGMNVCIKHSIKSHQWSVNGD